jgi:WXG100 family type VII secretion target
MSFDGMNVEAVRSLAGRLDAEGKQLLSVGGQVDKILSELGSNWAGRDFQEFRSWWLDQHKPALNRLVDLIEGLGRSAKNNADAQERVSDSTSGAAPTPGIVLPPGSIIPGDFGPGDSNVFPPLVSPPPVAGGSGGGIPGAPSGVLAGSNRTWQEVSAAYLANPDMEQQSADGRYGYQCTAWANFRWRELGRTGPNIYGHGWQMAANAGGTFDTEPLLGAMVSYGDGVRSNHVMIIEEISADGRSARVSEMNTGSDPDTGRPEEYRSDRSITKQGDGWYIDGQRLTVANLPVG